MLEESDWFKFENTYKNYECKLGVGISTDDFPLFSLYLFALRSDFKGYMNTAIHVPEESVTDYYNVLLETEVKLYSFGMGFDFILGSNPEKSTGFYWKCSTNFGYAPGSMSTVDTSYFDYKSENSYYMRLHSSFCLKLGFVEFEVGGGAEVGELDNYSEMDGQKIGQKLKRDVILVGGNRTATLYPKGTTVDVHGDPPAYELVEVFIRAGLHF